MTKPLLSKGEAKALAEKLIILLTTTDIAKGGCTVCGRPGHVAGHHDEPHVGAESRPVTRPTTQAGGA